MNDIEAHEPAERTTTPRTCAYRWLFNHGTIQKFEDFATQQEKMILSGMGEYMEKRRRFKALRENDLAFRLDSEKSNIFNRSNRTLGAVRSQILFKVAQWQSDLTGTTPWFMAAPEGGAGDQALAEQISKHLNWKFGAAQTVQVVNSSVETAANYGEEIVRVTYDKQVSRYERLAKVVAKDGEPVTTKDGGYLEEDAKTIMLIDGKPIPEGEPMTPEMEDAAVLYFADAPEVPYPTAENGLTFMEVEIPEEVIGFEGVRFLAIDFQDFRCPMGYTLADSPFRGHIFQYRRSELRNVLLDLYGNDPEQWPDDIAEIYEATRLETNAPKTDRAKLEQVTPNDDITAKNPLIKMLDAEILYVDEETGEARWFFARFVIPQESRARVVFVDYLDNWLPKSNSLHRSLYHVCAIDKLPNRWEGRGEWEKYEEFNTLVDQLWNGMVVRHDWSANPAAVVDYDVIMEAPESFKFEPGAQYQLQKGQNPREFMSFVEMPNTQYQTDKLINFVITTNMLETGVTSAAKGGVGDLPATNTATGIQSVLASGSVLSRKPLNDLRLAWEGALQTGANVQYAHQNRDETFTYTEGEAAEIVTLSQADVRNLTMNCRLTMTRSQQTETLEKARAAVGAVTQYLSLPEMEKGPVRPLFVTILKNLEVPGANDIVRPQLEQDPAAEQAPDPMDSIKITYDDLPPSAKVQLLQRLGFDTVTPEEIAAYDAAKNAPKQSANDRPE